MDWQLIDDHVVMVPASTYVLTGLPGDDEEYLIVMRQVCGGADGEIAIRPNNDDVPGHYGYQQMQVVGGDVYSDDRIVVNRGTTSDLIALLHLAEGELGFAVGRLYAAPGQPRTWTVQAIRGVNVTEGHIERVGRFDGVWNNTDDPITSLAFISGDTGANSQGVGTRILTFAKRAEGASMRLVERKEITTAVNAVTFSDLHGDSDRYYELRARIVNGNAANPVYIVRPNESALTCGFQYLEGVAASPACGRGTQSGLDLGYAVGLGHLCMSTLKLFAPSGQPRLALKDELYDVNGTFCGAVKLAGSAWPNLTDEITSLVVTSYNQPTNCLGVGTVLELWAA